ncbi:MAG: helix-turn-helix transcriptional regulator [Lentisphaeria bacterium]|nr:helix-turn-helix transcriptional regulator [Lentisphaeria bacterium]
MSRFSDMLVYLRKRAGLSQVELAHQIKMTRSAISMYETGRREPDLETLEAFADFFNTDMNTLTGNEKPATDHGSGLSEKKKAFMEEIMRMSDADFERLVQIRKLLETK